MSGGRLFLPLSDAKFGRDLNLKPAHMGVPVTVNGESYMVFGVSPGDVSTVTSLLSEQKVVHRMEVRNR